MNKKCVCLKQLIAMKSRWIVVRCERDVKWVTRSHSDGMVYSICINCQQNEYNIDELPNSRSLVESAMLFANNVTADDIK